MHNSRKFRINIIQIFSNVLHKMIEKKEEENIELVETKASSDG